MIVPMERRLFVFDVGGVVVFHPSVMDEFCAHYHLDRDEVRSDWAAYSKPFMDGFCGPEIMYRMFEHKYKIDLSDNDIMMTYYHPVANRPMIDLINRLRKSGHRVVSGSTFPATESQEKSHVSNWRSKRSLAPLMRPTKFPGIPVSLERNPEVFRHHFL